MVWSVANSKNDEASKIRWELVPYMGGAVLDIGCGPYKCFPHFTGVDSGHHWGVQGVDIRSDAGDLKRFSDESHNCVFSSHLLEHIPYEKVPAVMTEWFRVLKKGGHLILYIPDADDYPVVGHPNANPDHKWDCRYENTVAALEKVDCDWDIVDFQKRNENDEYSLFFCVKKL